MPLLWHNLDFHSGECVPIGFLCCFDHKVGIVVYTAILAQPPIGPPKTQAPYPTRRGSKSLAENNLGLPTLLLCLLPRTLRSMHDATRARPAKAV